ncbi:MAG: hypothetical protein HY814_01860 [Candidatus Riflebacteria bacterium]|nr:hypothetical protein [Candidatus Riflebacteria bacterium]
MPRLERTAYLQNFRREGQCLVMRDCRSEGCVVYFMAIDPPQDTVPAQQDPSKFPVLLYRDSPATLLLSGQLAYDPFGKHVVFEPVSPRCSPTHHTEKGFIIVGRPSGFHHHVIDDLMASMVRKSLVEFDSQKEDCSGYRSITDPWTTWTRSLPAKASSPQNEDGSRSFVDVGYVHFTSCTPDGEPVPILVLAGSSGLGTVGCAAFVLLPVETLPREGMPDKVASLTVLLEIHKETRRGEIQYLTHTLKFKVLRVYVVDAKGREHCWVGVDEPALFSVDAKPPKLVRHSRVKATYAWEEGTPVPPDKIKDIFIDGRRMTEMSHPIKRNSDAALLLIEMARASQKHQRGFTAKELGTNALGAFARHVTANLQDIWSRAMNDLLDFLAQNRIFCDASESVPREHRFPSASLEEDWEDADPADSAGLTGPG